MFILINNQLLSTANAKDINKDSYCSDFRNGIFVLGVVFFQTNFDFLTSHFDRICLYHSKGIVVLSLNLQIYFTCDHFLRNYGGLKVAFLVNLGKLMRDKFRAINA